MTAQPSVTPVNPRAVPLCGASTSLKTPSVPGLRPGVGAGTGTEVPGHGPRGSGAGRGQARHSRRKLPHVHTRVRARARRAWVPPAVTEAHWT